MLMLRFFFMEIFSAISRQFFTHRYAIFRQNTVCFTIITWTCFGCVSSSPKSEWAVLSEADKVDCENFDILDDDIKINSVRSLDKNNTFYLATHTKQTGQDKYYLWETKNNDGIKLQKPKEIILGPDQFVVDVGANQTENKYIALMKSSDDGGSSIFELRSIPDNVVTLSVPIKISYDSHVRYYAGSKGVWVVGAADKSEIFYLATEGAAKGTITTAQNPVMAEIPTDHLELSLMKEGTEALISYISRGDLEDDDGQKSTYNFSFNLLNGPLKKNEELTLSSSDPIKANDIESWNISSDGLSSLYLTFISGDSLSGTAEINTALIEIKSPQLNMAWLKKISSQDAHIADPIVTTRKDGFDSGFLQWLDEESTLHLASSDQMGNLTDKYYGIFAQSTVLMDLNSIKNSSTKIAFLNEQNELGAQFKLCKID